MNNLNLRNSDVVLEIVNIREIGFFLFFGRASVIHVDGVESLETYHKRFSCVGNTPVTFCKTKQLVFCWGFESRYFCSTQTGAIWYVFLSNHRSNCVHLSLEQNFPLVTNDDLKFILDKQQK